MLSERPFPADRPVGRDHAAWPRIDPAVLRERVSDLPPLPQLALDALATLRDDNSSAQACAARIGLDPALAARVLRLANSVFYGVTGRVGSLIDAVHVLGRRQLCEVVTAAMVVGMKPRVGRRASFDHRGFWRHAVGCAIGARALAHELALDEELAFASGLLHDIGCLVLAEHFVQEYEASLAAARRQGGSICTVEQEVLGTDHAEIGEIVVLHWRLPRDLAAVVRRHHQWRPSVPGAAAAVDLAGVVAAADAVAHELVGGAGFFERPEPVAWEAFGLKLQQSERICREVEAGVDALGAALE